MYSRHLKRTLPLICLAALSGCANTSKALDDTGKEFSQGNVLTGIWYGTMGVAMSALVDVATLGGTTDVETGTKTIAAMANQQGSADSYGPTAQASPPPAPVSTSGPTSQSGYTPPAAYSGTAPSPSVPNSAASAAPSQSEPSAQRCITVEAPSARNYHNTYFINSCNQRTYVSWRDEGSCRTGCGGPVGAGQRQGVSPHKGTIEWVACFDPAFPISPSTGQYWSKMGGSQFYCRR